MGVPLCSISVCFSYLWKHIGCIFRESVVGYSEHLWTTRSCISAIGISTISVVFLIHPGRGFSVPLTSARVETGPCISHCREAGCFEIFSEASASDLRHHLPWTESLCTETSEPRQSRLPRRPYNDFVEVPHHGQQAKQAILGAWLHDHHCGRGNVRTPS